MTARPISAGAALASSWSAFRRHFVLFAASLLTFFGAWVLVEIIVVQGQQFGILWWAAAHLAFFVFFAGLEAGFLDICLSVTDGRQLAFAHLFRRLAWGPKLLAAQLAYLLMVTVGLALLVVPGFYLGARYALFSFCMVDRQASVSGSFHDSAALSTGAMTRLMAILVSLLVFNLLGAAVLGIGLFVTLPVSVLFMTAIYRQLEPI